MGRPVSKRRFGSGSGNQIKVRFKTGGTEYDGYIVKQTGSKRYKVSDGTRTMTGYLVNKSTGGLANGDIIINVLQDDGTYVQATKLFSRVAIVEGTTKVKWNFTPSESDGAVQVTDVEGPTITILTQPADFLLDLSESATDKATFTINITGVTEASASYQWMESADGNTWANVSTGTGGTTATYVTETQTDTSLNGYKYKCVVTRAGASNSPLDSAVATLTVQA